MSGTQVRRWRDWSGAGIQHVELRERGELVIAEGAVLGAADDRPFAARFRIECDRAWRVRRMEAAVVGDDRRILLEADGEGGWHDAAGQPLPELKGAIDVDLPVTPFTNTLPIRRLGLTAGQSADLKVVYVLLPELTITSDPQRYVCLETDRRFRYESLDSDFVREIEVDPDGFVLDYPGLFKRVS
jgi:uncharacterized protein